MVARAGAPSQAKRTHLQILAEAANERLVVTRVQPPPESQLQVLPPPLPRICCRGFVAFEEAKTFRGHNGNYIFQWRRQQQQPGATPAGGLDNPSMAGPTSPAAAGDDEGWFILYCDDGRCSRATDFFWRDPFQWGPRGSCSPALTHFVHILREEDIIERFGWMGKFLLLLRGIMGLTSLFTSSSSSLSSSFPICVCVRGNSPVASSTLIDCRTKLTRNCTDNLIWSVVIDAAENELPIMRYNKELERRPWPPKVVRRNRLERKPVVS